MYKKGVFSQNNNGEAMNDYVLKIKKEFKGCNDLIYKKVRNGLYIYHIFYLETVSSSDKVTSFVLNGISFNNGIKNINKRLPSPNFKKLKKYDEINFYLCNGFTIIINKKNIYAIETRANLDRSISEPSTEQNLHGPKDSLVENIQINLGLIKRRLKTSHLKNIVNCLGRETKTITNLLYIDNITNLSLVDDINNKLKNIDVDAILDSGMLKNILDNKKNPFPTIKISERPDTICAALLNGKIVILVDNSPYALIVPSFLLDFINPASDEYIKPTNISFLKIIRLLSFILSIFVPAYYIAITTYNQETIPLSLLLNFSNQRSGVPFPAIIEAIIMLIICEILKESDLRFPNNYGSAISILGALVIGQAAVEAGIVSPIMIIVIAITFISSLLFSDSEITGAIRFWRFIMLIFASFYGLYGVAIGTILLIINITSYKSMYLNYTFPIEPMDINYLKKITLGIKNYKRSKYLTNNITKSK